MGIMKKAYAQRKALGRCLVWLLGQVRGWIWVILLLSLGNAALSGLGVLTAAINKWVVDYAVAPQPAFHPGIFGLLAGVTIFNMAFSAALNVIRGILNERFGFSLKERFFGNLLRGDWMSLSRFHSGDIMTRITGDLDTIANGLFNLIPSIFYVVFQFVMAFGVLYYYEPMLAVLALCLGPVGLLLSVALSRVFAAFQKKTRENEAAYRSFMQECMENVVIAKSFCQEEESARRMRSYWQVRYGIIKKRGFIGFGMNMALNLIFSGGYLMAFGWSLHRLVQGEITYGTVTLLLTLVGQVQSPIQSLQSIAQQLVGVYVCAQRVMELDQIRREDYGDPCELSGPLGLIGRGISFSYRREAPVERTNVVSGEEGILRDLDFRMKPGETVGIVGPSGAGKTTLIRLILSLVRPTSGELMFVDETGREQPVEPAARKQISYVPQGNTLLSGTIRENLLMGKPDAAEEELWEALRIAEAEIFVRQMPGGLDAVLLEKGGAVSEGQAQRIAIARAVVKPAALLILDEATASLDIDTETRIVENLKNMDRKVTRIVVTHRPSLLKICERTYRLLNGKMEDMTNVSL